MSAERKRSYSLCQLRINVQALLLTSHSTRIAFALWLEMYRIAKLFRGGTVHVMYGSVLGSDFGTGLISLVLQLATSISVLKNAR